ncbi:MAG TPA: tetratricopeptide repeat protein [Mucilaginibacter sp.]|jgi:tetratricopeptide (TPR) repeat protein|nr:tetratricopeptide repeat protein [Mucilaginibacter sp.]
MKSIPYILLLITLTTATFAQSRNTDDAQLLEYYQNQRFADALTYLQGIYQEPVTDTKELSRLAYTSAMANKLPDAERYYQRLYDKDSTNKAVLYNIAGIAQRRGNIDKAELYYKRLVVIDTLNFNAFNRLAHIYNEKKDLKNEVYYLQKANNLNPTDADVAADLSDAYILVPQFSKAEKVLNIAIAADPDNIFLLQSLLRLHYIESNWPQTVKIGERLLLLSDSSSNTLAKLGRAYYQTKNYTCGIATLLHIPENDQTENTVYFTAACYKLLKDQKKAIVYFNKAIELSISKGTATYYNEVADSYETLKQYKKSLEAYQKGLLYDDKPISYYFLATLYDTELKNKKNALKYYKKFVAFKPDPTQKTYFNYSTERIAVLSAK